MEPFERVERLVHGSRFVEDLRFVYHTLPGHLEDVESPNRATMRRHVFERRGTVNKKSKPYLID